MHRGATRVALDFAVINGCGQGHWDKTFDGALKAAVAYSEQKANRNNTRVRCREAGLAFEPMVFETQGGIEPRAAAVLHRIAAAVAVVEEADVETTKSVLLQRLAVIIARGNAKAIQRREAQNAGPSIFIKASRASSQFLVESAALDNE